MLRLAEHSAVRGWLTTHLLSDRIDDTDPQPSVEDLVAYAHRIGAESIDFDDDVHDAASRNGSAINDGGLQDQLRYLTEELGIPHVLDRLCAIEAERR